MEVERHQDAVFRKVFAISLDPSSSGDAVTSGSMSTIPVVYVKELRKVRVGDVDAVDDLQQLSDMYHCDMNVGWCRCFVQDEIMEDNIR